MADSKPAAPSEPAATTAPKPSTSTTTVTPPKRNQALRMLGLPALPRKLPSRNWLIFWAVATSLSGAIIYDRREKKRATARWAHAVSHLAAEPLPNASAMPRRLTIFLEAPPGDGLRVAQDHFAEYVKPVLAASGLDWEFVQGRQEGDIRAVVAERVRRARRAVERDIGGKDAAVNGDDLPTAEDVVEAVRSRNGITEYDGVKGDIIVGRHTWKEYVRGLHEGWLGPLKGPAEPMAESAITPEASADGAEGEGEKKEEENKEREAEKKPSRPPQIKPYNTPDDYPSSPLPLLMPAELAPAAPIYFPHLLGFLNTPTRFRRFLGRRYLADDIGREVAAVCLATYREFQDPVSAPGAESSQSIAEQQVVLQVEERDWAKSVWKETPEPKKEDTEAGAATAAAPAVTPEKIWARPIVLDSRISMRMRRFEMTPADEERARQIVVPEEEVEGWIKGSLRHLWQWGAGKMRKEESRIIMPDVDE